MHRPTDVPDGLPLEFLATSTGPNSITSVVTGEAGRAVLTGSCQRVEQHFQTAYARARYIVSFLKEFYQISEFYLLARNPICSIESSVTALIMDEGTISSACAQTGKGSRVPPLQRIPTGKWHQMGAICPGKTRDDWQSEAFGANFESPACDGRNSKTKRSKSVLGRLIQGTTCSTWLLKRLLEVQTIFG